ncbi:tetratricopeptide repeat protein [Teladorsagia circumcincta]|uniref:Tetratricopeptide repeat protein n=1 Tax=Teladorsagia circumcincta TaxID=45464 RepID=A0A2G9V3W2_TELCI|nr:tetratricopeptide repeat protein [Teladorsagia circumcincta]
MLNFSASPTLEFDGADAKALYRRALARENLDNVAAAFKDAKEALRLSPKDKAISEMLQRLVIANNEKVKKATSMDNKVNDMSKLAFEGSAKDKGQKVQGKSVPILLAVAEDSNEPLEISVCAIRIVDELIKNHGRALLFLSMHDNDGLRSVRRVCRIMCARDAKEYVDAAGLILQRIFNALAKMDRSKEIKPDPEVAEALMFIVSSGLMARATDDPEGHKVRIKLAALLITLLQGPVDLGVNLVTNDQVTAVMLQMAASSNLLMQSVAAELIVMTVVKHERATSILKVGLPILRKLYDSEDENVKVRALVGLCKCAAAGGDDASRATMKEGAALKLAHTCKKFLLDYNKYSTDVRRFACEGLSYLSLDADVKEWIVEDSLLLRALFCLAQSAGALCVYTLATIYVNLTNSYEKPQVDEELVKLAQFAKHHVPEIHPKDTDDYVEKRVRCLVEEGAVAACVAISKTESHKALELLARAMLAFSELEDQRGRIICEGGTKLCLRLTKEATAEGKIKAAHAIAKLGAKADPQIAFPGQRSYEASVSDSVRRRILKEKAVPKIEDFWFMTDHEHLRAAAAELLLNLLFLDEFYKDTVRPGTDKLKLWVLYAAEENERLSRAASAAFAILTEDVDANRRIFEELKSWPDVFKEIAMHEDPETQRRGLLGFANIMESDEKLCSEIVASELFRVLVAIAKLGAANESRKGAAEQAKRALAAAEKFGIIRPTDRELYERTNKVSTIAEE